jgi:hypothetical protein
VLVLPARELMARSFQVFFSIAKLAQAERVSNYLLKGTDSQRIALSCARHKLEKLENSYAWEIARWMPEMPLALEISFYRRKFTSRLRTKRPQKNYRGHGEKPA